MKLNRIACIYPGFIIFLLLAFPARLRAQAGCMLTPVPLAERVRLAPLVVEARVVHQRPEALPGGHLATRSTLLVFKVFKGTLPPDSLAVLTPGGTLGGRREAVSGALALGPGQQGVFLLEPDPTRLAAYRAVAGPQGFVAYDLATGAATEPFGRYPAIATSLYPVLAALAGHPYRAARPNLVLAALTAPLTRPARPAGGQATTATPVIAGFAPAAVTAGTSTGNSTSPAGILTINGSGFNASRGSGYVQFRNADSPGPAANPTYTQPLASDYLTWSDTQIRVRVPSLSAGYHSAGTGPVQVVNSDSNLATSSDSLTVTYALSNLSDGSPTQTTRVHLVGIDQAGGYTLHYGPSFPAAAQAPFEAALASWHCQAGANRTLGAPTTLDATLPDNVSVVRFDNANDPLPAGVLGLTYSYYSGCSAGGSAAWELMETDYVFSASTAWNYAADAPSSAQYDFQSVALHELGHGLQLSHLISATGVMNYAIANGQRRRALDGSSDLAAAQDMTSYSTAASAAERCGTAAYAPSSSACTLPVELVAFSARYVPGQGTTLRWATATERQSAYFGLESQEDAAPWQEISRQPAAGSSPTTRQYQALDPRPLAGLRYYRLRQVDLDGTTAYSPTVAVRGSAAAPDLAAYPNPATGQVHLSGPLAPGTSAQVGVLDALGRRVRQATGPAGQAELDLPLAGLPAGLYVLEWDGGAGLSRLRLTVE